jgi:hypothetical protein
VIEPAFLNLLKAAEPVAALVVDRIYFGVAPQNERRPRIVLTLVSANSPHVFGGAGGYTQGRMQLDVLAPTYPVAKELAAAARAAVDSKYSRTIDGTNIHYIECGDSRDIPMMPPVGNELPTTYGVTFDARFQHEGS